MRWPLMPSRLAASSASVSGCGIEVFDAQFAIGERGVFLEQVVDAAHVELHLLGHVVGVARRVVADDDGRVEFVEDGAGAVRERVDLVSR